MPKIPELLIERIPVRVFLGAGDFKKELTDRELATYDLILSLPKAFKTSSTLLYKMIDDIESIEELLRVLQEYASDDLIKYFFIVADLPKEEEIRWRKGMQKYKRTGKEIWLLPNQVREKLEKS